MPHEALPLGAEKAVLSPPHELVKDRGRLWDNTLGRRMSLRMERALLPGLRWNQEVYAMWLQKCVGENTVWLDAGCGHRLLPPDFEILERELIRKTKFVVGVDLSVDSLQKHKTLASRSSALLEDLPFRDHSFDLVTCNMVVEHLPDPSRTFREFGRVLRPGGFLLIHTPNVWNYAICLARLLKKLVPGRILIKAISWAEERGDADIFPTFYRANLCSSITSQLHRLGFSREAYAMLVGPQTICRFFAPLAFCELLWMRATMWRAFRSFATTMLLSFRKI